MARIFNVSPTTIYNVLRKNNIERRDSRLLCRSKPKLDARQRKTICRKYVRGYSTRQIGMQFGVEKGTILRVLKEYKVPLRQSKIEERRKVNHVAENHIAEICKRYDSGETLRDIAQSFGISKHSITAILRSQNVTIRPGAIEIARSLLGSDQWSKMSSAWQQGISLEEWTGYKRTFWEMFKATEEYQEWRLSVFRRDGFQCRICCSKREIQGHHILPKAKYFEKALDTDNGITLCRHCHEGIKGKEEQWAAIFIGKLNLG